MRALLTLLLAFSCAIAVAIGCTLDNTGTGAGFPNNTGSGGEGGALPGCAIRSDCPEDLPCRAYACSSGQCEVSFAPAGSTVAGSASGDCKRRVCNATGIETTEDDNSDTPDDGNDCTDDVCTDGVPSNPARADGVACGMGPPLHCAAGKCVGCTTPDQCSHNACQDPSCVEETCGTTPRPAGTEAHNGDVSSTDCLHDVCDGMGGKTTEADPDDTPDDMNACTTDTCNGIMPLFTILGDGDECPTGFCYMGTCSACGLASDCAAMACKIAACNGTCSYSDATNGAACGVNQHCFGGTCSQCGMDANCPVLPCMAATCPAGTCQYANLMDGTTCGNGDQCCAGACTAGNCGAGGAGGGG